jgi:hypothetical protein
VRDGGSKTGRREEGEREREKEEGKGEGGGKGGGRVMGVMRGAEREGDGREGVGRVSGVVCACVGGKRNSMTPRYVTCVVVEVCYHIMSRSLAELLMRCACSSKLGSL